MGMSKEEIQVPEGWESYCLDYYSNAQQESEALFPTLLNDTHFCTEKYWQKLKDIYTANINKEEQQSRKVYVCTERKAKKEEESYHLQQMIIYHFEGQETIVMLLYDTILHFHIWIVLHFVHVLLHY